MNRLQLALKRTVDLCASIVGCIVLTPLWIVAAIAIKVDSKGPIFFRQERRTKDGRIFNMLKYRSMVVNAEQMGTGLFSYDNDPRITKVGRFLRRASIDELPQLFNVLKGDISLVGPRPCVKYELGDFDTLNKKYKKRFQVKGGITGLAQAKGRNENSWDEKVTLDNEYIDRFAKEGVLLDLKILWWTVAGIFKSKNINELKIDENMSDEEAALLTDEEVKRIAHLPD
ncbi:MAG: sugar transferase [Duncaniella sp.]|uniref:sugar transferase n=1 Tax=Duncaniella sp. TaxID=2518496 RepID=UPI0023D17117|nr:sugar transferase [Duncaniella sp.]MDE6091309.1 sugar transferase [Duncaniella sp.]